MASNIQCLIGTAVRVRITFVGEDGKRVDPDVVTVSYKPDAVGSTLSAFTWEKNGSQDPNILREGLGIFSTKIRCTVAGNWKGLWESTGNGEATEDFTITVTPHPLYVPH